jgi:hypothetical protein
MGFEPCVWQDSLRGRSNSKRRSNGAYEGRLPDGVRLPFADVFSARSRGQ